MTRRGLVATALFCGAFWGLVGCAIGRAQGVVTNLSAPYTDAQAQAAVAGLIPQPLGTVPPAPTPGGLAGSGLTYVPGNAATLTLCRRTSVTTDGTGGFTVTWAVNLVSSTPWGGAEPIWNATTMPPICWIKTISASGMTGQCTTTQTTALNLSIVTAGLTLNPFGGGAAALAVKVHACEPTQ